MALSDLKAKLAAVATAVKESVATAAADRIEKAKAKAAERLAKAEKAKEQKYLLDCLPGTKDEKISRLGEIETAAAEYQEICKLLYEAETELLRAKNKAASADRDQLVATAQAVVNEVKEEKERIERDHEIKFFGWLRQLENMTENPNRKAAIEEIDRAITDGFLREITGERAREIQESTKAAKEEDRQPSDERNVPFFYVRVKPHGSTPQGEQEPDDHFRYISGGVDFYERSIEGARKRRVFFTLQDLWKACTEVKKAAYEAAKEVREKSYLTIAEAAAGKTGQVYAEVTREKPWRPTITDQETGQRKPFMKDGKEVINFGPFVVEVFREGGLRFLNVVQSGMFHPLRVNGAWDENGQPVDFKFFPGNNPQTGQPNNFAGLRPVKDTMDFSLGKCSRLRAILCLAGDLKAPAKEANSGASKAPPEAQPGTQRGHRSDGSKAGEARSGRGKKKDRRRNSDEEVPEMPRNVQKLSDVAEE